MLVLGLRAEVFFADADFFVLVFIPVVFFLEEVFFREGFFAVFFPDARLAGCFLRPAARFVDFFFDGFFLLVFLAVLFFAAFFEVVFLEVLLTDFFFVGVEAAFFRVLERRAVLACFREAFLLDFFFVLLSFFFFLAAAFRAGIGLPPRGHQESGDYT